MPWLLVYGNNRNVWHTIDKQYRATTIATLGLTVQYEMHKVFVPQLHQIKENNSPIVIQILSLNWLICIHIRSGRKELARERGQFV